MLRAALQRPHRLPTSQGRRGGPHRGARAGRRRLRHQALQPASELVARVKAVLRRGRRRAAPEPVRGRGTVSCATGACTLDLDRCRASWDAREVVLTVTEFGAAAHPAGLPRKVYTRDELMERAYAEERSSPAAPSTATSAGCGPSSRPVGAEPMETVHGLGYSVGLRVTAPARPGAAPAHGPGRSSTSLSWPCRWPGSACCASTRTSWSAGRRRSSWCRARCCATPTRRPTRRSAPEARAVERVRADLRAARAQARPRARSRASAGGARRASAAAARSRCAGRRRAPAGGAGRLHPHHAGRRPAGGRRRNRRGLDGVGAGAVAARPSGGARRPRRPAAPA